MGKQRRMSLILIIALLAAAVLPAVSGAASPPRAPLTPAQVNVAGSFEEAIGGANWNNDDPLTDMGDANLDGVWKFNATFPGAGSYEYKIVENADWGMSYPADNVPFTVADGEEVGWLYDENDHYVSDTTRHVVATAVGDWPEAIGGVNWAPDNLKTWMKDPDGDGVYAFSAALPAGDYQFKVAMNESWTVSYPADNVPFTVPAGGSDVTFFFDSATNDVTFEVGGGAPPLVVTFPGDWPEAAGLGSNWTPGNLEIQGNDDNGDGVWKFVTDAIPAGSYVFKAAVGGTWDENYGVNGAPNGDNVPFSTTGGEVNFYYDRDSGDNFVASRPDYTIPVVVGDFLAEIGGANWSPDNLRSWMKDPDGDDVYTFIAQDVPEGDWQYKVAIDESWAVSYPQDNILFNVPAGGGNVTFSYNGVTHEVGEVVSANTPPDEELVRPAIQTAIQDNVMYFALTDRMWNADPSNDEGAAPGGTLAETGFLPTDKSFYHGGDLQGMIDQLDYLEGMGINSIWLTPVFENIPTQPDISTPYGIGGSYHGYWALDWENADPHLGTNAELQAYIDAAHSRGIKVFFDIVANHSADIISYVQNEYAYRNKADYPYRDADGQVFDDRDYASSNVFPPMDVDISFPYTPTVSPANVDAKNPPWLNDLTYYHNRGDSTFAGESSQYGDFFGLDDLFTEQVDVVDGFIGIFNFWVDNFDIDGYRLDTAKHVNIEFWQRVAPAVLEHAQTSGKPDFTMFGEVFDGNPEVESYYTTVGTLPSVLDFGLHGAIASVGINNGPTDNLANLFASDDYFTDADSNAYQLATFISNHDLCRAAYYLNQALPNASDDELVARVKWGYAMLYFARGFPVVYYGDEQGFTGGGGDKLCREDMLPSQVPDYMDEDLIGTDLTPADDNFDTTHPIYQALADFAAIRDANLALRRGAQITRYATDAPGVFAFSRIERDEQVEVVVVFNSATTAQHVTFPVYLANTDYLAVYPAGEPPITTSAGSEFTIHMMPGEVAIYKASAPLPASDAAPEVTFTTPAAGAGITGRAEIGVTLSSDQLAEVTFAVKVGEGDWQVIGTDTNPPYRVFFDTDGLDAGTPLAFRAIANDLNDHLNGASSSAVVGAAPTNEGPKYAVIHYYRDDGDYGDPTSSNYNDFWGLHLWGDGIDSAYLTDWTSPQPFFGEDEYGVFAWVELSDATKPVNFIVHRGDTKDPPNSPDRSFNPQQNAEIWLRQGDVTVYESQADAQGFVTIRYHRPAGDYGDYNSNDYNDYWGLHLWTSLGGLTDWTAPKKADGIDDYGAYFIIAKADYPTVLDWSLPLNFIVHKGDVKDPPNSPDRSFIGDDQATIWLMQDDEMVYNQQGAAQNFALLHYRRPAGDYGDYNSSNYQDFWGMHVWGDTTNSVTWTEPLKPVDQDNFGVVFKVDLTDNAQQINYIFHRGDEKDPGPDQFLPLADYGYEVWQLQGADPELPYVLPVPQVGGGSAGNLNEQRAHWVQEDVIAWEAGDSAANTYKLCYAPDGGLETSISGITGGECINLLRDPNGLPQAVQDTFPHLADLPALKIDPNDVGLVPEILKGQFAVSSVNAEGVSQGATGLQIPGVLDDLYTYDGALGVTWADGVPTVSVWAPTAKNVAFELYADSDPATEGTAYPMTLDPATGVWSVTGEAGWNWQYYLFDVEVWVNSTQAVEHNLVTDPYSISLAMNSIRSQIVDLSDASLEPAGWNDLQKPPLPNPEDISLYELHIRDFSVNDPTVPDEYKGTFKAFTLPNSNGMQHLQALQQAGLSHLHLLPVFDIATIDENKSMWQSPSFDELAQYGPAAEDQQALVSATADLDAFNWGYDPWHYTTPEGSYSTDPDSAARILEFREMVKALNETGLRVVMDVVYNHTNSSGQAPKSVLDRIVPGYYHRLSDTGAVETSTCCQNTASEHAMMEKLMIDSVDTWATAYKVDGFRFDLMGHHMKSNMVKLRDNLDSLTVANSGVDGSEIYLYGEGWNFGEVADNARGENATQINMAGTGIGTFNDRLRDGVRGGGPFDNRDDLVRNQGFANGQYYDPNSLSAGLPNALQTLLHQIDLIKVGMTGNLSAFELIDAHGNLVTGSQIDYNGAPAGYTDDPQEDINYVSAHDNQTLWDINAYKIPTERTPAERARVQVVGEAPVLLGQGIPFVHAGADILRSKSMDRDSYNSGDWFNRIDWTMQSNEFGMGLPVAGVNQDNWYLMTPLLSDPAIAPQPSDIQLATGMLQEYYQIRYSSPLFRLQTAEEVENRLTFYNNGPDQLPGLIIMGLSDAPDPDLDPGREQIVVLINANDEPQTFTDAAFAGMDLALNVIQANGVDAVVKTASFDPATGSFTVPGRTAAVFDDFLGLAGTVTQTPSTNPAVIGTYVDVDVSATNYGDTLPDALFLAPIDPDTEYVPGSAWGGAYPLTAAYAAQLAVEKGLPGLADAAEGRSPDDVVAVAWAGEFATGETIDFGFAVQVTTSSGEVQTSVALFDGATFVTSFDSDPLTIVDNSAYPVSRSMRFNVDRDSYINGTQPSMYYGSDQTMWLGFYDQMRPVVHTPLNGIPGDSAVDQAWLYLYVTEGRKFGNWSQSVLENVTAHPATTEWMPYAVNWWMPWTMPGGDYGPGGVPNHLGSGKIGTWLRLDITAAVQDMLRSGQNQGFLLNSSVNASGVHYGLATKEFWDASKLGYIRVYYRTAQ